MLNFLTRQFLSSVDHPPLVYKKEKKKKKFLALFEALKTNSIAKAQKKCLRILFSIHFRLSML
jgi:hypothetical protein